MEEFELEPGEKVIRSVRKHWFVFFAQLLPFAILALVPTWIPGLMSGLANTAPQAVALTGMFSMAQPWFRFFLGVWWLFLWMGAFTVFTQYFLNHWIITNTRIISIYQRSFFNRQVTTFLLSHIQDVTTTVDGFFATLFHYGTVRAETAGEAAPNFLMINIPDPTNVRDLIMREIADVHDAMNRPTTSV